MIKTLNLNRQVTAILENAFDISYEKQINSLWLASFSLPYNDQKKDKVKLLQYVEIVDDITGEYIGLFRIIPKLTTYDESNRKITYKCEHVLATLLNSPLFRYHECINRSTTEVLQYLLDQQLVKHWRLGVVEYNYYFSYSWENENNLFAPILSVPKPFNEQYRFTWDTTSYPWTLNLVHPDTEPTCRIRQGHNLVGFEIEENPMSQYNRIYCLGYGEGINQLGIEKVNGGIPYVEDVQPGEEIIATTYIDRSIEDANTLKSNGLSLLTKWKTPIVSWRGSAADVSSITKVSIDELREGKVVRLELDDYPVTDLRIMKESKGDILGDPGNIQLEIGNLTEDLGTTQSNLERRQQINEIYSQGATTIFTANYQDNCDQNFPAIIPFTIDDDVVNVNTLELTFRTKKFRAYSRATQGGGATIGTTSSGGGSSSTTSSGGASVQTSEAGGDHYHMMFYNGGTPGTFTQRPYSAYLKEQNINTQLNLETAHDGNIYTYDSSGNHQHGVNLPAHTHGFTISSHAHDVTISDHVHEIQHEINENDTMPTSVTIKVDGNVVPFTELSGDRINLVAYMGKDGEGRITRGRNEVTIAPSSLARIEADIIGRVFIQSRLGGTY